MTGNVLQIRAAREAGEVQRCHALPHHSPYNLAIHSYGAVSLLLLLHPDPSLNLIKALMFHDVAERWLGDVPSPGKAISPQMGLLYEEVERDILNQLEMNPLLGAGEVMWLRAMDTADLYLWCIRESELLGNKGVGDCALACYNSLDSLTHHPDAPMRLIMVISDLLSAARQGIFSTRLSDFLWTQPN